MVISAFRDSIAWQKAMTLSTLVYAATRSFPKEEMFGLTNQLRRASVSIPSNIAERKGRLTKGELLQFLGIARGSTMEVQTQLELAIRLDYGDRSRIEEIQSLCDEVLRILNASIVTIRAQMLQKSKKV